MRKCVEQQNRIPLAWAPAAAFTGAFYILRLLPKFVDWYTERVSAPVRGFLSRVFAKIPFSFAELVYAGVILWALYYLIKTFVIIFPKNRRNGRGIFKRFLLLLTVALWLWGGYCWLWGIEYYSDGFSDKSGVSDAAPSVDELYAVAALFSERANELSALVERDAEGHFSEDADTLFADAPRVYDSFADEFDFLAPDACAPKRMLFSGLMGRMGYTGFYFPFTGEANLNMKTPAAYLPATIAHELAHQRDIASEAEANFVGIAACVSSELTAYQYSGYLQGLGHLMNALYYADSDLWHELRSEYAPGVLTDVNDNSEYWSSMKGGLSRAFESFFDAYLKQNGQTLGVRSYGACVNLLVSYFGEEAMK